MPLPETRENGFWIGRNAAAIRGPGSLRRPDLQAPLSLSATIRAERLSHIRRYCVLHQDAAISQSLPNSGTRTNLPDCWKGQRDGL